MLAPVATGSTPSFGLFLRGIPGRELAFDLRIISTTYIFRCAFSGYASPMQTPTQLSDASRSTISPEVITAFHFFTMSVSIAILHASYEAESRDPNHGKFPISKELERIGPTAMPCAFAPHTG
jgi:hypothetical protein